MKKGKIRPASERNLRDPNGKHVIIERDENGVDPLHDWDQVFLLHSNIPREFCGNEHDKNYESPLVEIEDEDGYGTGEFKFREGLLVFPVSAYIHSGIALRMGSIREFACDPGGWDTTPNAAYLWCDRERWEGMNRPWMHVMDEETKQDRPAKDWDEFRAFAYKVAESELKTIQQCWDGQVYGYRTEVAVPYRKVYRDGTESEEVDWEGGEDSCWGYVGDDVNDIDFPKDDGWEVFDSTGAFAGGEYGIPEFVVTRVNPEGTRFYLSEFTKDADGKVESAWVARKSGAMKFSSWWLVQSVAQDVIDKEDYCASRNCVEIDSVKEVV